jgi:hypothetical protein
MRKPSHTAVQLLAYQKQPLPSFLLVSVHYAFAIPTSTSFCLLRCHPGPPLSRFHITAFFFPFIFFSSLIFVSPSTFTYFSFLHSFSLSLLFFYTYDFLCIPLFSSRATIPTTFTLRTIHITDKLSMNDSKCSSI